MSLQIPTVAELDSYKVIATIAATNPYWRKAGGGGSKEEMVATILSIMLMARELGLKPISAISGLIQNIQGKFEISARGMNMLIRMHGHRIQVVEWDSNICTVFAKRKDTGEETQISYHIEEANLAGLIKPNSGWVKNPKDMLWARCISRIARSLFADCIGGCYVEGELQESMLGKPYEALQDTPEVDMKAPESIEPVRIEFSIPSDIHPNSANLFLAESSATAEKPVKELIHWANNNPEKFINKLRAWEDAKSMPNLTPDPSQVLVEA